MGCGTSRQTNVDTFDYDTQLLNDVTRQFSVVVNPNDAHVGETPIRRHPEAVKGLATCVHPEEPQPVVTLWEAFQRGVRVNKNGPCFGMRVHKLNPDGNAYVMGADGFPLRGEYHYQTYAEVESEARAIGAGLASIGVQAGQHVGFYSKNRSEWMIGALGCWSQSMVIVALYDTLGAESTQYIINHSGLKVLFVSKDNLAMLLPSLPSVSLTHIIQFDVRSHINNIEETVDPAVVSDLASRGIKLMAFSELLNLGNASSTIFPNPAKSDDTAYTMYTSGTTGQPKGAMIGHQTLCSSIEASRQPMKLDHNDVHLSYLPLAHIFECGVMCAMICHGASVAFSTGIIKRLTEDIQGSRPTRFFGVPRVYQRIYTGLIAKIDAAGGVKAKWFHSVLRSESLKLRQGNFTPSFHAKFLMGKVRHAAGLDRVKSVITGAAPCPSYLLEFLRVLMQCDVIQGLGMTESCCVIAASDPHDHLLGHVGPPMICNEIKLVDVEEMGYLSTDKPHPRGEIWIRGNNVFKGYYNDPENNAAVLKPDGWLATGDVGRWNPNGTLSVIDRRKNLFKLSQGEYVAAEHIESLLSRSPVVGQIFVYGNSFKSFLIGVVVPNADFFQKHAMENGWWPADAHDVRTGDARWPAIFKQTMDQHLDEIREIILDSLRENSKQLKGFEIVKDWLIETDVDRDGFAFNTSNSLMTPTFKIRRPQLLQKYVGQFQQMYTRNGEADKPGEHWPGL